MLSIVNLNIQKTADFAKNCYKFPGSQQCMRAVIV